MIGTGILGSKIRQVSWISTGSSIAEALSSTEAPTTSMRQASTFVFDGPLGIGGFNNNAYDGTIPFVAAFNTSLSGKEVYLHDLYKTTLGKNLTNLA